jgi:hypothetical protein
MEVNQFNRHGSIPEYSVARPIADRPANTMMIVKRGGKMNGQLMAINVSRGMQVSLC